MLTIKKGVKYFIRMIKSSVVWSTKLKKLIRDHIIKEITLSVFGAFIFDLNKSIKAIIFKIAQTSKINLINIAVIP
ncbi:hypothetical protein BJQ96_03566 [Flavobacterium sp. PL0002]|nr:hypothetical protein [Flavobacterium sp. PL002]